MSVPASVVSSVAGPFTRSTSTAVVTAMSPTNGVVPQDVDVDLVVSITGIPDVNDTWIAMSIDGTGEPVYYGASFASGWTGTVGSSGGVYTFTCSRSADMDYAALIEFTAFDIGVEIGTTSFYTVSDPLITSFWTLTDTIEPYLTASIPGFNYMSKFCGAMLNACGPSATTAVKQKRLNELAYLTEIGNLIGPRFTSAGISKLTGPYKANTSSVAAILPTLAVQEHNMINGLLELQQAGVKANLVDYLRDQLYGKSPQHKLSAASVAIQLAAIVGNNLQ